MLTNVNKWNIIKCYRWITFLWLLNNVLQNQGLQTSHYTLHQNVRVHFQFHLMHCEFRVFPLSWINFWVVTFEIPWRKKSEMCTKSYRLLGKLQEGVVVFWLIWGCFSGNFQHVIQRKALFLLRVVVQGWWTRWNAFVWCQMRKAWKRIGVMEWVIERWGWLLPRVQQKFSCITLGKLVRAQWRER